MEHILWRIWFRYIKDGKVISDGQSYNGYERKCDATRIAKKKFHDIGNGITCEWVVAREYPWEKQEEV